MGFFAQLEKRIRDIGSLVCVGIDPRPDDLPESSIDGLRRYCFELIDAVGRSVAAFKPNSAFFEAFGPDGMAVLRDVVGHVADEIPVILDAKRGDIASTADAYAHAAFGEFGADAITVNPYLGRDSIEPFCGNPDHGIFLLCKTSNPGAADFQDLPTGPENAPLFEHVARQAQSWNKQDNVGLVVGATQVEALRRVRDIAPTLWFLSPGVGAQGANLDEALSAGLRRDGSGMLINVSRSVARAADPAAEVARLNDEIHRVRAAITPTHREPAAETFTPLQRRVADALLDIDCVRFGTFTLKSGLESPIYVDLRRLIGHPRVLHDAAATYRPMLEQLPFDHLAALPYAAMPIATAIGLQMHASLVYPRKESKSYGTAANVEGVYAAGDRAVVIDDVATTGSSKVEGIEKLATVGLNVRDIVVLIDRQSGARESLANAGYTMHAVFTLTDLLDHWDRTGRVASDHIAAARKFIDATSPTT